MRTFRRGHVPLNATREELVNFAKGVLDKARSVEGKDKPFAEGVLEGLNSSLADLGFTLATLSEIYP